MKIKILLFTLCFSGLAGAQSLADADRYFERFEYSSAAKAYEEVGKARKLDIETRKKLAYSYYVTGEYAKCYPVVDSLTRLQDIEPFFLYMHGNVAMEQGKYDESKASFQKYRSLSDEFNVDVLIQSCDSLKIWVKDESIVVSNIDGNLSKADINGGSYKNGYFAFRELGVDSLGFEIQADVVDFGEMLLAKPFLVNNEEKIKLALPSEFKHAAVTSAAVFPGTDQALITITQPSHKDEFLHAPHLYTATITENGFTNVLPWSYSGLEDTTGCAFATISAKGDRIVFSKQGHSTKGSDLYITSKVNDSWTKPERIESLNTDFDEIAPIFTGDSLLSFSSDGRPGYGSLDIYTVSYDGNSFGMVHHPNAPVNSYKDDLNLTWINDTMALFTSNRGNGIGDDDIYGFSRPRIIIPEIDPKEKELEEYLTNWTDRIILFDYDKHSIKDQKIMEEIADALKKFDGLQIVIEGHTDSRGVEIYNMELGRQRALTVRNEFIKLGVKDSNVQAVSKGEEDAIIDCSKGCTEEQHQQNRVAIIKIKRN